MKCEQLLPAMTNRLKPGPCPELTVGRVFELFDSELPYPKAIRAARRAGFLVQAQCCEEPSTNRVCSQPLEIVVLKRGQKIFIGAMNPQDGGVGG
jgi:hypothetical protein